MSLFTVKQVGFDGTLVVGAAHAVAADGWWVFQDADGRPLAALPVAEVDAIESSCGTNATNMRRRARRVPSAAGVAGTVCGYATATRAWPWPAAAAGQGRSSGGGSRG